MANAKIEPLKDGPLRVTGVTRVSNSRGEPIPVEETLYLCRCGGSQKKPFCDGTHKKIGFSGKRERTGAHGPTVDYAGREITIHDNRSACAHIGHCTEQSPEVFSMKKEPWIDADGGARDKTAATVKMCPSGALSYTVGGTRHAAAPGKPGIDVLKDGPYFVIGAALECEPAPLNADHYTLCRCGASKNKPYCDGSHWDAKFRDG